MTSTTCPICGLDAEELSRTGQFVGFDCPQHGKFGVSDSVLSSRATGNWENALKVAQNRAQARGGLPVILTYDF